MTFLVVHLCKTYAAVLGAEAYNAYQRVMRLWYQQPVLEVMAVLVPLIVHAASNRCSRT